MPSTESHIHLLQKNAPDPTLLANKRPLSLINTDERLFSQAHNRRLAPQLVNVIHKTQTGFIPGRHIDENIASMQLAMDKPTGPEPFTQSLADDALVAILDFQKAYDRLSHEYLDAVLDTFGFGPRARQWYRCTYSGHTARVFMNGWLSRAFDLKSGVRQGDPLAPSLFALAIEPLAVLIRLRVTGRTSTHKILGPYRGVPFAPRGGRPQRLPDNRIADPRLRLRELLFADDAYCRASGSKLNQDKSFLYAIGNTYAVAPNRPWLRITRQPFRYLGILVGRGVDSRAQWRQLIDRIKARTQRLAIYDLPLATKCAVINTYCYSKIVFYDRFDPAPQDLLDEIKELALVKVRGTNPNSHPSPERITTPVSKGGFGLHDLDARLLPGRARWVYELLHPSASSHHHLRWVRTLVASVAVRRANLILWTDFPAQALRAQRLVRWSFPFLPLFVQEHWQAFPSVARFCALFRSYLPGRWQAYATAWQLYVKPGHNLRTNEQITNWIAPPDLNDGPFRRRSSPSLDYLVRFDNQPIRVIATFKLMTQTICEYTYATVMTRKWKRDLVDGDNEGLWLQWYATLKALRRRLPEAVDTAHWLATHNLRGGKHIGGVRYATNAPNNAHRTCMLCRVELETLEHVFANCRLSQLLWRGTFGPLVPYPPIEWLVRPPIQPRDANLAVPIVLFAHHLWKLVRARRRAPHVLDGQATIDELAKSSQAILYDLDRARH
ncbi:hypothetical protein ACM66B_002485 [Microbotryomycetes sp. NB124-2]